MALRRALEWSLLHCCNRAGSAGGPGRVSCCRARPRAVVLPTHKSAQALVKLRSREGHGSRAWVGGQPLSSCHLGSMYSAAPPARGAAQQPWLPGMPCNPAAYAGLARRHACVTLQGPTSSIQGVCTNRGKGARLPSYEASKASFRNVKTSTAPSLQRGATGGHRQMRGMHSRRGGHTRPQLSMPLPAYGGHSARACKHPGSRPPSCNRCHPGRCCAAAVDGLHSSVACRGAGACRVPQRKGYPGKALLTLRSSCGTDGPAPPATKLQGGMQRAALSMQP